MSDFTKERAAYQEAFTWWPPETFLEIAARLTRYHGAKIPARVEMREGNRDGLRTFWFTVVPEGEVITANGDDDPLNISNPCPPRC